MRPTGGCQQVLDRPRVVAQDGALAHPETSPFGDDDAARLEWFGGFLHSYWQLYFGYELFVTISCLVECGLLWQLANLSSSAPSAFRPMILLFFLGEVATSILMLKFFFLIPIVVHSATALCLALAVLTPRSPATQP